MGKSLLYVSLVLCALSGLLPADAGPQGPAEPAVLEASRPIERHLARGDEHRYQITLAAGEYASVIVEQKGIDAGVSVSDVAHQLIGDFQDEIRRDGEERIEIVADTAGPYTLTVKAADSAIAPGDYTIGLASRREATAADRTIQESRALRTAAARLDRTGKYAEALPLLERALSLAESLRGPDDSYIGLLVFDLAGNALVRRDDDASRRHFERALTIFDRTWGPTHPQAAMARSRLGLAYDRAGQPQKAEALVKQALPVLERTLGREHPWFLQTQVTLANLRSNAGDLKQAEETELAALATLERTHQTGTMLEATFLNNLADVRRQQNDLAAAEPLFRRSLEIADALQGSDTLFASTALQNLGIIARERKNYASALSYYAKALAVRERLLGPDHPTLGGLLNNLANIYRATGDDVHALETHFRALHLWERTVGPYAREVLLSVGNIARTYAGAGDIANALVYQRRTDAILEAQIGLYLATGSERQKLAFVRSVAERTDRTVSLHLNQAPDDPDAAALAALVLLQRKGRVQDAMTDVFTAVRQHATAGDRALMDRLKDTTTELARLALTLPGAAGMPVARESLHDVDARKEQLEATLSDHSAEFRARMRTVTVEGVQAAIPADAALLEFLVFRPFDSGAERNEEAYGPPHYAAYVIRTHAVPVGVDLGAVEDIDKLIVRLREALRDPSATDVKARARALDERVMRPVRAALAGATRLLISPDGTLNLVPFEVLVDEHGRYLIERTATTYLTSGRDLLRLQTPRAVPGRSVIIADPLFGEPVAAAARQVGTPAIAARRSVTSGADLATLYFAPLSASGAEARAIKGLFPDAALLTGRRATKALLEQVNAPRILHIASHGFFLEDDDGPGAASSATENPLLRSGLALAGANLTGAGHGDGILTALEAAGLNLWGTKLVTLSACDTGLGQVRNGEGVYGLRRAFMLAGSETLVMSLWPVSDATARDTMVAYYARLRTGLGRGDALRQAKLAILKQPNLRHPYYWAAFIQSGDWTGLNTAH